MNEALPTIDSFGDLKNRRVLVRMDLNVPMLKGHVSDDYKIRRAFSTLRVLQKRGARIIVLSHLDPEHGKSLRPAARFLSHYFPRTGFFPGLPAESTAMVEKMTGGGILVLEDIRRDQGEEKNSAALAQTLARLADTYVNEAFAASHRSHASIVRLPMLLPAAAGELFLEEVRNLSRAFAPAHPFLLILGGAKFSTKLPLVKRFLSIADRIYLCGALANVILKRRGLDIQKSKVDRVILDGIIANKKVIVPEDLVWDKGRIVDAGPAAVAAMAADARKAKLILWNGPLGICEEGFTAGTDAMARVIGNARGESIVGGGDTIAALKQRDRFTFVSTGGGAMLDFLAKGTLPGIEALKKGRT